MTPVDLTLRSMIQLGLLCLDSCHLGQEASSVENLLLLPPVPLIITKQTYLHIYQHNIDMFLTTREKCLPIQIGHVYEYKVDILMHQYIRSGSNNFVPKKSLISQIHFSNKLYSHNGKYTITCQYKGIILGSLYISSSVPQTSTKKTTSEAGHHVSTQALFRHLLFEKLYLKVRPFC